MLVSLMSFVVRHLYTDTLNTMEVSVHDGLMESFVPFSVVAIFASWKMGCAGEPEGKMNVNQLHQPLLEMLFEQMSLHCLYFHAN